MRPLGRVPPYQTIREVSLIQLSDVPPDDFDSYVDHARDEWEEAGIDTTGQDDKSDSTIEVYGGSREDLERMEPNLEGLRAVCALKDTEHVGNHTYNEKIEASRALFIEYGMLLFSRCRLPPLPGTAASQVSRVVTGCRSQVDHLVSCIKR